MATVVVDTRCLATPFPTGIGTLTTELLRALFAHNEANEYILFHNSFKKNTALEQFRSLPHVRDITTRYPNKLLHAAITLFGRPSLTRLTGKADVFFSPNINFTAITPGERHILTIHDISFALFPWLLTPKQRLWHRAINPKRLCQQVTHIITPSHHTRNDVIEWFGIRPEAVSVIHPGLPHDFAAFQKLLPEQRRTHEAAVRTRYALPDNYVLYVGAYDERKNITAIVTGFAEFAAAVPNDGMATHLVLSGPGFPPREKLMQRLSTTLRSALHERVHVIGYAESTDRPALYACAKALLYPSWYEGFGFPLLEAMAVDTPIITSSRSSAPEVAGMAAYYIDPHRPSTLADALYTILYSPSTREHLIRAGQERVKRFSWITAATELTSVIQSVAEKK